MKIDKGLFLLMTWFVAKMWGDSGTLECDVHCKPKHSIHDLLEAA